MPRTLWISGVAVAVVTVATVAVLGGRGGANALATGEPGDLSLPGDSTLGVPSCASGFTTLVHLEPFLAGGVNPHASDTAEAAAQRFMENYLRLGRGDGTPIGVSEVRRHDALTFFVPSPDDPDRAQIVLEVAQMGGRFAVGVLWACDGSLPRWEQEQPD